MEIPYVFYLPILLALYIFTKHFLAGIRNLPPSPFLSFPVLGHLYLIKKPLFRSLAKISDRYGPVLLLDLGSRPVLVVSSAEAAEECLHKHDVVFANRPDLLPGKYLGYGYTSLVWAPYGDHWRNLRKLSALELLSSHRLQTLHGIRADEVRLMLKRAFTASRSGKSVEVRILFFELMLNVMMRMIAGKRYYGENVEEVEEARRFRAIVQETMKVSGASNMVDFLPILGWLGLDKSEKGLKVLQEKRDEFLQELVEEFRINTREEKETGEIKNKTLIEVLLALQEKEPDYYSDEMIRSLMLVLLSAGTDTSVATMEWTLSAMLNHPSTFKKAQQEMDEVVGTNRLLDESDLPNLPYLGCIINESMRMNPVGPLLVPHQSSSECTVGGYRVPAGTMMMVNLWAIQNDPKNWADPRKFNPERFEGIESTKDGYRFMPFGTGRRSCPGENLAMKMVGFGLGSVIQCFEWEKIGEEMVDMSEGAGLTMPKHQPLVANCRPRPQIVHLLSQI